MRCCLSLEDSLRAPQLMVEDLVSLTSITLRPGAFCGEELLTWSLMGSPSLNLPSLTQTVLAFAQGAAFSLQAKDLNFVASQFKRLHSKKLQHAFRYYSHQWRTWRACFIQAAAWRRFKKSKMAKELTMHESFYYLQIAGEEGDYVGKLAEGDHANDCRETTSGDDASNGQNLGATILASKFAAKTIRGATQKVQPAGPTSTSLKMPKMFKPDEPNFASLSVSKRTIQRAEVN